MPADRPDEPATEASPRWGLIADDLTGACDAAVQFALAGFGTIVSLRAGGELGSIAEMTAISTATRDEPARDKVRAACRLMSRHGIRVLFKKTDSTLRGNVGAEIQTVMEACEFNRARERGLDCSGPYPADTVFLKASRGDYDLVVAMYHDHGHIPMKLLDFEHTVNISLGLPIIRTSVDHGTAFDIAGKNQADATNMKTAMKLAVAMAANRPPGSI